MRGRGDGEEKGEKKKKKKYVKKSAISTLITLMNDFELNGNMIVVYEENTAACRHF